MLALGCPALTSLSLAFCGSAVSDSSLRSIALHLLDLRYLSVRGCIRVTGKGVEAVLEGCTELETFDVSQCRNLLPWIEEGGCDDWRHGRDRLKSFSSDHWGMSGIETGDLGFVGNRRKVTFVVNAGEEA